MDIILLDYNKNFKIEDIKKFADSGIKTILSFDWWWQTEPAPGVYDFSDWLAYEDMLKQHGIKLLVQTPIGVPFWANDPSWYLMNYQGQNNFADDITHHAKDNIQFDYLLVLAGKFFSYWNPEAESYVQKYIKKIKETLKHAVCIPSIGQCGEYLFPAIRFMFTDKVDSPWWFDPFATQKCQESGKTAEVWIIDELARITKERLSLYQEKWLQYVPYFNDFDDNVYGNVGCENIISENKENLKTILFSVFSDGNFVPAAEARAKICPTYAGAEGAEHIIENIHRAKQIGLKGLVCAPFNILDGETGITNSAPPIEDWMFENIKIANKLACQNY